MKNKYISNKTFRAFLLAACIALCTLFCIRLLANYDNKYIAKAQIVQENTAAVLEDGYYFLVDDWEMYPDVLLSPDDFASGKTIPHYKTWAGEYPNLSLFHDDKNPYGTATYRLRLRGNGMFSLYLPEPLCAANVFVGGQNLGGPGEVSPEQYTPAVRDTVYSFLLEGETDLIIQVTNYSHYYGGLWYPPAIGNTDSIHRLIASRMICYGLLFFTSLTLSLFCIVLWNDKKNKTVSASFYFGLLCLSFALRICHPFLRLWGVPLVRTLYALEDVAALAGIFFSIQIAFLLFLPENKKRLRTVISCISLGMCLASVVIPLVILPTFPGFVLLYGIIISWYKLAAAIFLIGTIFFGCLSGRPHTMAALAATSANGIFLLSGVIGIGYFEPVIGAWPEEYGAFCMVIAFAVIIMRRSRALAKENERLNEHLQEEVAEKTLHLQHLLTERGQLIAELGHDMKSPLTSLSNMVQIIRLNDIILDEDTREKILHIEEQCGVLSDRLRSIQELVAETGTAPQMKPLLLNKLLSDFYQSNRPVVELTGPDFLCMLTPITCEVMADSEKLSRALENLVYNATSFTPPEGRITLSLSKEDEFACIQVSDTGCGIAEEDLPKVFHRFYTTRGEEGGQGLGLAITHAIVLEHNGETDVASEPGKGCTFTVRLPLLHT